MKKIRLAVIGCGFWSRYQVAGWLELEGVEVVALYNRTLDKARELAKLMVPAAAVYTDAEKMLTEQKPDVVDIITDVDTHELFTMMAARYSVPVICQKPMAPALSTAANMLAACKRMQVPFYIHENFRWQHPIRTVKDIIDSGEIGLPFKARVSFCSAFPVFDNQPFLATLNRFILTDIGSHILDVCRFLFGEVKTLFCATQTVNPMIRGEDVANILMRMDSGLHCYAEMSYASIMEKESFPQTLVTIEGSKGSVVLGHDFILSITTVRGTRKMMAKPPSYPWADPAYDVVHSSIVACNANLLQALRGEGEAESTGADNFETVKLVWAAYSSAERNTVINMSNFTG